MRSEAEVATALFKARQKWKDTGDEKWAFVEGGIAWALGQPNVEPSIAAALNTEVPAR